MFEPRTKTPLFEVPKQASYRDDYKSTFDPYSRRGTANEFLKLSGRGPRDSGDVYKKVDRSSSLYSDTVVYARNLEIANQEVQRLTSQLANARSELGQLTVNLAKSDQVMLDYRSRLEASEDLREKACRTTVKQMDVIHTLLDEQKTLLSRIAELEHQVGVQAAQTAQAVQTDVQPQAQPEANAQNAAQYASQNDVNETTDTHNDTQRVKEELERLQEHVLKMEQRLASTEADAERKQDVVNKLEKKLQRTESSLKKAKKLSKKTETAQPLQEANSPSPQPPQEAHARPSQEAPIQPSVAPAQTPIHVQPIQSIHPSQPQEPAQATNSPTGQSPQLPVRLPSVEPAYAPQTPSLNRFPSPSGQPQPLQTSSPSPSEAQLAKMSATITAALEPILEKLENHYATAPKDPQEQASDNALHKEAIVAALQEELLKTQDDPAHVMRFVEPLLGTH